MSVFSCIISPSQTFSEGDRDWERFISAFCFRYMLLGGYSQAVDGRASFSALPLPLVHLSQQVEESLLGVGDIAVCRPAQELELTHHQLTLLELQNQNTKHMESDSLHCTGFHALVCSVISYLLVAAAFRRVPVNTRVSGLPRLQAGTLPCSLSTLTQRYMILQV